MGLAEKRKAAELQKKWTVWEKQINEAMKCAVPIEVKWDTIVLEQHLGYVEDAFEKIFVNSIVKGFTDLCSDDLGKDAVASAVKKLVIQNTSGIIYGDNWCTFQDGAATFDHDISNADNIEERAKGLVDSISKAL